MIAAVSLIALLGMLVLTIDLGRSYAVKRDMENATSAAALAAAQQCALGKGLVNAQAASDDLLDENTTNLSSPTHPNISAPECDALGNASYPKLVRVDSSVGVNYFFAGILPGANTSGSVSATATAAWGPALSGATLPLRITPAQLTQCNITDFNTVPDPPTDCWMLFDNKTAADWQWLFFGPDGQGWNVDANGDGQIDLPNACAQTGGSTSTLGYLNSASFFLGNLKVPPPTYVCTFTGNSQPLPGALKDLENTMLSFPVTSGDYPVEGNGSNVAWPVTGFLPLYLVRVYTQTGQDQPWPPQCPIGSGGNGNGNGNNNSEFCVHLQWQGPQVGDGGVCTEGQVCQQLYYGKENVELVK